MQASTSTQTLKAEGPSLWSEILDSVKDSRGVLVKNAVVLGSAGSGKSILVSRLDPSSSRQHGSRPVPSNPTTSTLDRDLGMVFSTFDIEDEDEEVVARLGAYQISDPDHARGLLKLALPKDKLQDSVVVVCLDWESPWTMIRQLLRWLRLLGDVLVKDRTVGDSIEAERARHQLDASVRKASTKDAAPVAHESLPLPEGVLVENLGVPLVITCTKADYMAKLERENMYKDEHFDNVQQVLRTIALHYGASVFYTTISRDDSFDRLRAFLLHKLFGEQSTSSTMRSLFAFKHEPNVVDRDQILIPSGWDTWGKIKLTRESFDPSVVIEGWEADLSMTSSTDDEYSPKGVAKLFESAIPDAHLMSSQRISAPAASERITAQPEQEFLKEQYDLLLKEREKDPRAAFASRPEPGSQSDRGAQSMFAPSVVGPMSGASSLKMANVEKAFENAESLPLSSNSQTTRARSPPLSSVDPTSPRSASSLLDAARTASGTDGTSSTAPQNEVLANFFQSLLQKRTVTPDPASK